jgi:magnesium transporter
MSEIVEGLGAAQRERIAALRKGERFFWVDVVLGETTRGDLSQALVIPDHVLRPLLDFGAGVTPSRRFYADGEHVVFGFSCFVESLPPVEVHVLVCGDYLLTLHEAPVSLPDLLDPDMPEGRSEQYVVYSVLDAMVATGFDALDEVEPALEELQLGSTDLREGRGRMARLREVNSRLSELRRTVGPQRGGFERISVEIGQIEGLRADSERYFERIAGQLNRLVDGIDAAADAMAKVIDLRLNETTYWLTVVATIFLPLTFITGFFGMNFGWMVDHIDTALAFVVLGIGSPVVGVVLVLRLVRRGSPIQQLDEDTGRSP